MEVDKGHMSENRCGGSLGMQDRGGAVLREQGHQRRGQSMGGALWGHQGGINKQDRSCVKGDDVRRGIM